MKTFFTSYDATRGEYEQETETAETLNGYKSGGLYFNTFLILFAIGGNAENNYCDNWDIYADKKGTLYSIARPGTSCGNSYFGDCNHIKNLIRQGYFSDTLTEYGKALMNA
ncbi:MAG: hypothetical protein IKE41_03665 [Clostridia bacterium]|nr:hypothetical protein [Clostridia bacterium]